MYNTVHRFPLWPLSRCVPKFPGQYVARVFSIVFQDSKRSKNVTNIFVFYNIGRRISAHSCMQYPSVHTHAHTHTYIIIYIYIYNSICINLFVYLFICSFKYLCMYLCLYVYRKNNIYICIYHPHVNNTSNTAQGGGGSFEDRKPWEG